MRWLRKLVVLPIRLYQKTLSPLLGPHCRYSPSCSAFAIEAILRYGIVIGGLKAVARLLRCHPLFPGGYDPVDTAWPRVGQAPKRGKHTEEPDSSAKGNE